MNRIPLVLSLLMLFLPAPAIGAESFMLLSHDGMVSPVQLTVIGPDEVEVMDSNTGFMVLPLPHHDQLAGKHLSVVKAQHRLPGVDRGWSRAEEGDAVGTGEHHEAILSPRVWPYRRVL